MSRQTRAQLEQTLQSTMDNNAQIRREVSRLADENKVYHADNAKLERDVTWLRQLSQNLSEAICAHMRSR